VNRGGSGVLVIEELRRAILSESAAALQHWSGVGESAVWAWRRAFGVAQFGTDGSARRHWAASGRGAETTRGVPLPAARVEVRRRNARRLNLARYIHPCPRPGSSRPRTAAERPLLGALPDGEPGARIGRLKNAVRVKRSKLSIPAYPGQRRKTTVRQ
jgi:hypothetical protein